MMNFEALRKTAEEANGNLEHAFASLAQGITVFEKIAVELDVNNLRQALLTIDVLLDEIGKPLTVRRNLEDFKSQIELLQPGISAHVPSVSDEKYIKEILKKALTLGKLLSGWDGALKAIQSFPKKIQAELTRVEQPALSGYSDLIEKALKKVEKLSRDLS